MLMRHFLFDMILSALAGSASFAAWIEIALLYSIQIIRSTSSEEIRGPELICCDMPNTLCVPWPSLPSQNSSYCPSSLLHWGDPDDCRALRKPFVNNVNGWTDLFVVAWKRCIAQFFRKYYSLPCAGMMHDEALSAEETFINFGKSSSFAVKICSLHENLFFGRTYSRLWIVMQHQCFTKLKLS